MNITWQEAVKAIKDMCEKRGDDCMYCTAYRFCRKYFTGAPYKWNDPESEEYKWN